MFEVVIQLGAICAVIFLFFHKLNPFSPQKTALEKRKTWDLWGHVVVALSLIHISPGTAGKLKLYDTDPKTAAMLMAIVADKMGKPINELRFISIKEVK